MPVIQGTTPPEPSGLGMLLETVLNSATAWQKGKQDKAYRTSAAKLLGVDPTTLGHFQREEIKELIKKKKFEPQEYKPSNYEEWLKGKEAESGLKSKEQVRTDYRNYLAKVQAAGRTPMSFTDFQTTTEEGTPVPLKTHGWQNVSILDRIKAAITPTATPEEQVLGPLRPGGIFNPPQVDNAQLQALAVTPVAPTDPIAVRIKQAQAQGITNNVIAANLREKGIDPAKYGL